MTFKPADFGLDPETRRVTIEVEGATIVCSVPRSTTNYAIADVFDRVLAELETDDPEEQGADDNPNDSASKPRSFEEHITHVVGPASRLADIIATLVHSTENLCDETGKPIEVAEPVTGQNLMDGLDVEGVLEVAARLLNVVRLSTAAKKASSSPTNSATAEATTCTPAAAAESSSPSTCEHQPCCTEAASPVSPSTPPDSISSTE